MSSRGIALRLQIFFLDLTQLAPVVQNVGSAIHRVNQYPVDKY